MKNIYIWSSDRLNEEKQENIVCKSIQVVYESELLCIRSSHRWSRTHYVFGLSVHLCVRSACVRSCLGRSIPWPACRRLLVFSIDVVVAVASIAIFIAIIIDVIIIWIVAATEKNELFLVQLLKTCIRSAPACSETAWAAVRRIWITISKRRSLLHCPTSDFH